MKNGLKGLVMLSLAYFLFSRITSGTLFFSIHNRFAWLTFLAVIGFFVVAPLSIGWRYLLPLLFWGVHVGIDELQSATLEHTTAIESVLFVSACVGIFAVKYRRWIALTPDGDLSGYMSHLKGRADAALNLR